MTPNIAYCSLIVMSGIVITLSVSCPTVLGDSNAFLKNFVNHEFLNILGVVLAITVASAAQLHLTFNQIEERFKKRGFSKARSGVQQAAYWLIGLFLVSVVLVVAKPLLACDYEWAQSLFNGAALLILLWYVLVLIALTQGVFAIKSHISENDT